MNYQTINAKEVTGVNHALISKMINGELTNPTLKTINKLLECLQ